MKQPAGQRVKKRHQAPTQPGATSPNAANYPPDCGATLSPEHRSRKERRCETYLSGGGSSSQGQISSLTSRKRKGKKRKTNETTTTAARRPGVDDTAVLVDGREGESGESDEEGRNEEKKSPDVSIDVEMKNQSFRRI